MKHKPSLLLVLSLLQPNNAVEDLRHHLRAIRRDGQLHPARLNHVRSPLLILAGVWCVVGEDVWQLGWTITQVYCTCQLHIFIPRVYLLWIPPKLRHPAESLFGCGYWSLFVIPSRAHGVFVVAAVVYVVGVAQSRRTQSVRHTHQTKTLQYLRVPASRYCKHWGTVDYLSYLSKINRAHWIWTLQAGFSFLFEVS